MNKFYNIFKSKYFIVFILFLLWISFFDRNNLIRTIKTRGKVKELKEQRSYYLEQIEETKRIKNELLNNTKNLEKFAREQYFMKKDNEEIFIIEEE